MEKSDSASILPMGRLLTVLGHQYFGALSSRLEYIGIDRHYSILLLLEKEEYTQQDLCYLLKTDKVSMVRILDYLESQFFIKRKPGIADRRQHRVTITAKGLKYIPIIKKAIIEIDNQFMTGLSREEKKVFKNLLSKMFESLPEIPATRIVYNIRKIKEK